MVKKTESNLFNLKDYFKQKEQAVELIKMNHDWEKTEGFIADGIISPEMYKNQKVKVLFMLGESYGYDKSGIIRIEDQSTDDVLGLTNRNVQTTRKIASLIWILFKSLEIGKMIDYNEMPNLFCINDYATKELQWAISKCAWINVKKASKPVEEGDNTRQDYMEIYDNAKHNKDVLKLQIDSIRSDYIMACSYPVFNSLYDMRLLGENIKHNMKYEAQVNHKGQKIIQVSHPSYFKEWGYEGVFNLAEIIFKSVNN